MSGTEPIRESPALEWSDREVVITAAKPWFHFPLTEIWRYRDLIWQLLRRDIVTQHKQTVLGPVWFFLQPIVTSVVMTVIFGQIAGLPTDEIPKFLFYLSGITIWQMFSNTLTRTSNTFATNASLFTKVYFPRLAVPVAQTLVGMWYFLIQFLIFLGFWAYFLWAGYPIEASYRVIILPVLILQCGLLAFGIGCLTSSFSTRFRDLQFALGPLLQLWMYASCIFFPRSMVPEQWQWLMSINPMVPVVEAFRFAMMGRGEVEISQWLISLGITLIIFLLGVMEFGRAEKNFADTI